MPNAVAKNNKDQTHDVNVQTRFLGNSTSVYLAETYKFSKL